MNKVKEFYQKHKKKIAFASCVIGAGIVGGLITKGQFVRRYGDLKGKDIISWTSHNRFINLERAKEILDLNANNTSQFAIFKEKPGIDGYVCIVTGLKDFVDPTI